MMERQEPRDDGPVAKQATDIEPEDEIEGIAEIAVEQGKEQKSEDDDETDAQKDVDIPGFEEKMMIDTDFFDSVSFPGFEDTVDS